MNILYFFISLIIGMLTARFLLIWILRLCQEKGFFDAIAKLKTGHNNIPRIGGSVFVPAVMLGTLATLLCRSYFHEIGPTIFISSILMGCGMLVVFVVGLVDDIIGVSNQLKWTVKIVACALFPLVGLCLNNLFGLFWIGELSSVSSYIITFLLTLCIVESINAMDDTDGLSGSLSALFLAVVGSHFFILGYYTYAYVAISLLGALLVFLYFNMFGDCKIGTKVYMGNCGTLILGFIISYLALKYAMDNRRVIVLHKDAMLVAFSLLLFPLFEYLRVQILAVWHLQTSKEKKNFRIQAHLKQLGWRETHITALLTAISLGIYLVNEVLFHWLNPNFTWLLLVDIALYATSVLLIYGKASMAPSTKERTAKHQDESTLAPYNGNPIPGLVSVIMPTWNSSGYVTESIRSVLNQTYKNLELIITDDASTDGTPELLQKLQQTDPRIRLILNKQNGGAGVSRNCSIRAARGQYLAFLDSDDCWMSNKLERQVNFMQEKDVALCFCSYYTCNADNQYLGYISAPRRVSLFSMMCDNKIGFLTAIYDTTKLGKHLMPSQRKRQDHALLLTLLKICKHAYSVPEPLASYRLHAQNMSGGKLGLIKYNARTYKNIFGWKMPFCYLFLFTFFLPTYFMKRIRNLGINIARTRLS